LLAVRIHIYCDDGMKNESFVCSGKSLKDVTHNDIHKTHLFG